MAPETTGAAPGRWSPLALAATWLGSGYLPGMPGTWGSLAALPAAWLLGWAGGPWLLAAATLAVALGGTWVAGRYAGRQGGGDPKEVVIDEVAGQWLALVALPLDPLAYALAFAAFRLFDTVKPWPIRRAERLPEGVGIVADDLAAGAAAGALAWAVWTFAGGP